MKLPAKVPPGYACGFYYSRVLLENAPKALRRELANAIRRLRADPDVDIRHSAGGPYRTVRIYVRSRKRKVCDAQTR